jgi:hypothetical protein
MGRKAGRKMESLPVRIGVRGFLAVLTLGIILFASAALAEDPYEVAWSRQLGSSQSDQGKSIAVDASGNIYMSGNTRGSLSGPRIGGVDAFLAKFNATGNLLWMEQLGTTESDWFLSVELDNSGNVYVGGFTYGSLAGPNSGSCDAYLVLCHN